MACQVYVCLYAKVCAVLRVAVFRVVLCVASFRAGHLDCVSEATVVHAAEDVVGHIRQERAQLTDQPAGKTVTDRRLRYYCCQVQADLARDITTKRRAASQRAD
jgi:hypothetical protein